MLLDYFLVRRNFFKELILQFSNTLQLFLVIYDCSHHSHHLGELRNGLNFVQEKVRILDFSLDFGVLEP